MTARCQFKDLCLDVADAEAMAEFWAPTLGLTASARGQNYVLTDGVDAHTVWLNTVPEPRSAKNRVHLDVHVATVEDALERGARVVDDTLPWTVLADPEGGEFCAFERAPDQLPTYRLYELVADAAHPEPIARWWAERFGAVPQQSPEDGARWLEPTAELPWELIFSPVPEPKITKNRVHWDVWGDTDELVAAGARLLTARTAGSTWDVLADPEGNEFCVFPRA